MYCLTMITNINFLKNKMDLKPNRIKFKIKKDIPKIEQINEIKKTKKSKILKIFCGGKLERKLSKILETYILKTVFELEKGV